MESNCPRTSGVMMQAQEKLPLDSVILITEFLIFVRFIFKYSRGNISYPISKHTFMKNKIVSFCER